MSNPEADWRRIWSQKGLEAKPGIGHTLEDRINLGGWDSPSSGMTEEIYVAGVRQVESLLGHGKGKSLLDLGCGAGAFVGALERTNFEFITGVDGSPSLVSVASGLATFSRVVHHRFTRDSSDLERLLDPHDYVVAISVLQYLGHESGLELIRSAFRLSREKVMFFDIPDIKSRAQAERLRSLLNRAAPPPPHTYYSREGLDPLFWTLAVSGFIMQQPTGCCRVVRSGRG